jgi:drug/metabolite transporter (DMT)-like permease
MGEACIYQPGTEAATPTEAHDVTIRDWVAPFMAATVLTVASHLLMKAGVIAQASRPFSGWAAAAGPWAQPLVLGGLMLYGLAMICWMMTVSKHDVSFLYPLTSVNYVLVVVGSVALFGERVSATRALGVALVVVGVALVNVVGRREQA